MGKLKVNCAIISIDIHLSKSHGSKKEGAIFAKHTMFFEIILL
jgi:hypothetical protein